MMILNTPLLLLLISAVSVNSADKKAVTDCVACNENAECQSSAEGDKNASPTCSCKDGFVGDGVSCYNSKACDDGSCCDDGFYWSSESGCEDIDECSSENSCPPNTCENTPGSYDCKKPPESHQQSKRSADQNQNSVLLQCGDVLCPAGQDCISVEGHQQCRDPCLHNAAINDAWRSTDLEADSIRCDRYIDFQNQWYRLFLGESSARMPEWCVPTFRCGTHAPLWLPDGHPELSDGIVLSPVCGHWNGDCCLFPSNSIHIKACPGNYFVYKLVHPNACHLAYCSDANSLVCDDCGPLETCVSEDGVNWRCERKALQGPQLVCGQSLMEVGFDTAHLAARGLDVSSAHLADFRCTARDEHDGMVWFQMERKSGNCGTLLTMNDTHAIYSNALFVYPANQNESFSLPERMPLSCVYPLDSKTSLDVAVQPELSLEDEVVGVGARADAVMHLYRSDDYSDPYSEGAVSLPLGSPLHVGVSVEEAASNGFSVILEDCYSTPSADADDPERHYQIQDRCPSDRRWVKVEPSGPSLPGRFTALVNLFNADSGHFFLHCSVSICDPERPSCTQTCLPRVARSVSSKNHLRIGPITWEKAT